MIFSLARTRRGNLAPAAVGAYIGAAYFFTSSTSFANPAIDVGRMFSDTFAGIAPASVPAFVVAQLVGGAGRNRRDPDPLSRTSPRTRRRRSCCRTTTSEKRSRAHRRSRRTGDQHRSPTDDLGEGLGGAAAEVGVEHPGDLAGALAGGGDGVADQAGGAEAEERSVEADVADLADQLHGGGGVGAGAAEDDRGRVEGAAGRARAARRRARWRASGRGSRRGAGSGRAPGRGPPRRPGRGSSRAAGSRPGARRRRRGGGRRAASPSPSGRRIRARRSRSGSAASWSIAGSSSSSTVRSSGRSARLSSIARSAAPSSKLSRAAIRPSPLAGAAWRWRASSIAEEMLPVWASASRRVCSSTSS